MPDSDSAFLSIEEIARDLQLKPHVVQGFVERGELVADNPGAAVVVVSRTNLARFYDDHRIIR